MSSTSAANASLIVAASDLRVVRLVRGAINADPAGRPTPRLRFDGGNANTGPRFEARPVVEPAPRFEPRPVVQPRPLDRGEPAQAPKEPAELLPPPRFGPLPPPWLMPASDPAQNTVADAAHARSFKPPTRLVEVTESGRLLDQFV